jgi:hypothetical protein
VLVLTVYFVAVMEFCGSEGVAVLWLLCVCMCHCPVECVLKLLCLSVCAHNNMRTTEQIFIKLLKKPFSNFYVGGHINSHFTWKSACIYAHGWVWLTKYLLGWKTFWTKAVEKNETFYVQYVCRTSLTVFQKINPVISDNSCR